MKPIIAITGDIKNKPNDPRSQQDIYLKGSYAQMVVQAGGCPIIIPPGADVNTLVAVVDGWLIPGGDDIDPKNYGAEKHSKIELQDPDRFKLESALYQNFPRELPILAICYGCQFLNVMEKGDLIQHLPDKVKGEHTGGQMQTYLLDPGSLAEKSLGVNMVQGKSYHHQAIATPGKNVVVTGHHEDGTIEAIEISNRTWALGVQWHPERTPDDPATQKLFREFVLAARHYQHTRNPLVNA